MPKQTYALEAGGEKRLEISWKLFWKEVTLILDGRPLGVIPDQKALAAGQEFRLPDGSGLKVQLVSKFSGTELQVLRNGKPLPGSSSDPGSKLKLAYGMVYFIAGLYLLLGFVVLLFNLDFLRELGIGWGSIIYGLLFFALGFFVQRKSNLALILAILLFALDGILAFFLVALQGNSPSIGGLMVRIFLLIPMIQGVGAIKQLKQEAG